MQVHVVREKEINWGHGEGGCKRRVGKGVSWVRIPSRESYTDPPYCSFDQTEIST